MSFIRENAVVWRWASVVAWVLVGLVALRLARADRRQGRWCFAIGVLALGFAVETAHPMRFALTELLRDAVRALGGSEAYGARRVAQAGVIACLLLPFSAYLALRVVRDRNLWWPTKLGLLGVGVGLTGFALEVISLHHLDQTRFLYSAFRCSALVLTMAGIGCAWKRSKSLSNC